MVAMTSGGVRASRWMSQSPQGLVVVDGEGSSFMIQCGGGLVFGGRVGFPVSADSSLLNAPSLP
jgi:hypothetical protein